MDDQDFEVVKWFTRARRFPKLIGKTHEGTPIPGGPYTITQVVVGAILFALLVMPPWPWAVFGNIFLNAGVFFLVVVGGVFLSGRLPIGMRNPLIWAEGVLRAVTNVPAKVRLPQARLARGRTVMLVGTTPPPSAVAEEPPPSPEDSSDMASPLRVSSRRRDTSTPPARSETPFTGVQRLLAASTPAPHGDDR